MMPAAQVRSRYVLITPAHNEQEFIEKTILSMIQQTVTPLMWVVVDDGSSDRTAEIVGRYSTLHHFIKLVRLERQPGRGFGHKVHAFERGLIETKHLNYEFVGNLDADISFQSDYFENLFIKFRQDDGLGLAGGSVHSLTNGNYICQQVAPDSVAGAVQLFRKACFDAIGGYRPLPLGGIDSAAEIMARMKGWTVRTFFDLRVFEQRRTGSATRRPLAARMHEGRRMYALGYAPVFFLTRCIYRSMEKPRVVGSLAAVFAYTLSALSGQPKSLEPEVVTYLRREQGRKLKSLLLPHYSDEAERYRPALPTVASDRESPLT